MDEDNTRSRKEQDSVNSGMSEEHTDEPVEDRCMTLSASSVNYNKVIFADIPKTYPLENITVRFENAEGVVVGPDDFIGIYKIGFQNVSECLLKGVWRPEDEVIFEAEELRKLDETECYQFVYVSSEENIYGTTTPFRLQPPNEGLFAEISEDNFLIVQPKLKEEAMNLKKGMQEVAICTSVLSNGPRVVEQQNSPTNLLSHELKEKDSQAEAVKQCNSLFCKELQRQKEFQRQKELHLTNFKKFMASLAEFRPPPKFLRDNSEIHEDMSTSVNSYSSQASSLLKNSDVPANEIVELRIKNGLLTEKIAELEKKIAEQNVTHVEAIEMYHRKIKVLNEQNSLTDLLRRELEEKESQVEAIKQSNNLVRGELQHQQELQMALTKKNNELLIDEAQLANKASTLEKVLFVTKQELKKVLNNVEDLKAEKKVIELKVMELEERFEASKAVCEKAAETKVRDQELISKLTEHKELIAKQMNKMSSEHCEAMEVLKTEKDLIIKDLKARLDEASTIFKQQYREIEKLRRRTVRQLNAKKIKTKSESISDDKNSIEQEGTKNVLSSHVSSNVFSNSVSDSVFIDVGGQEKANPSQLSNKQHDSPLEEHYFGVLYTTQPAFTYQPSKDHHDVDFDNLCRRK